MDYIKDKDLYKAVVFASKMLKEGQGGNSFYISANYYGVDVEDIKKYVQQLQRDKNEIRKRRGIKKNCKPYKYFVAHNIHCQFNDSENDYWFRKDVDTTTYIVKAINRENAEVNFDNKEVRARMYDGVFHAYIERVIDGEFDNIDEAQKFKKEYIVKDTSVKINC